MKYRLSFCEIEQISDNIFEVTVNDGSVIDAKCAEEAEVFWKELRKDPYYLLVNNKNRFLYSFIGSKEIGENGLERKTAILVDDLQSMNQMLTVIDLKKMSDSVAQRKVFEDRNEAMSWLTTP